MKNKVIGASEIAAIMGVHPYTTPYDVWSKKKQDLKSEPNAYTIAGNLLEPVILKAFSENTGVQVYNFQQKFVHPDYEFLICYSDALGDTLKYIISAKNTSKEIDKEEMPIEWYYQINFEMGLSGIHEGHVAYLSKGYIFDSIKVFFNDELFDEQVEFAVSFYNECIIGDKVPSPINSQEIISRIAPQETSIECEDDFTDTIITLKGVKGQIKELEEVKARMEEKIKLLMVENTALTWKGKVLATWKQNKDGVDFDKKALEQTYPDIFNEFISTKKGARVLLVK